MEDPKSPNQPCPTCGYGGEIDRYSDLDLESDLYTGPKADNEMGNADQEEARKARLDGIMNGISKRRTSK